MWVSIRYGIILSGNKIVNILGHYKVYVHYFLENCNILCNYYCIDQIYNIFYCSSISGCKKWERCHSSSLNISFSLQNTISYSDLYVISKNIVFFTVTERFHYYLSSLWCNSHIFRKYSPSYSRRSSWHLHNFNHWSCNCCFCYTVLILFMLDKHWTGNITIMKYWNQHAW